MVSDYWLEGDNGDNVGQIDNFSIFFLFGGKPELLCAVRLVGHATF